MSRQVITVENISKNYGRIRAVDRLGFTVEEGTCFGCLGPNGAGKTTMMKMIYGKAIRNRDCDGTLEVFGYDPRYNELDIKYLAGVVPQEDNLDEELNVIQNLSIYARFYNIPSKTASQRIKSLLEFMELTEKAKSRIKELSGGMKRRLVIVRALINEPKLLILDEPTTGLDPQVRHLIWEKLRQLKRGGTTILLTTHYMEEAFQLCDKVLIMHKGREIIQGQPKELLSSNLEQYVLEFVDGFSAKDILPEFMTDMRIDKSGENIRLFSNDMDKLKTVANTLTAAHFYLREANLEDLFLKATGASLDE